EMEGGTSLQCSATVLPADASNPTVVWSVVSGTGSASISSDGMLMGLTAGTVYVVATAADGSGVSHSLAITITSSVVLVSDIAITSAGDLTVVDEGNTLQFTATVLPANATNPSVSWSVHQQTGSAVISQSGLLTAGTAGTVDVKATAYDGSGVSIAFALTIHGPDGLFNEEEGNSIVVYPNPSTGKFYLDAGMLSLEKVQVFSVLGFMVLELLPKPGQRVIELDLSDQKPGAFFIHTLSKEQSSVHRVIISR
ncbi:MAG: Ig-like domain-containing protein, partial [Bacteroidales bacterium]|nr:Ig-like domain-containing protein [Bacteroidales bacterium]